MEDQTLEYPVTLAQNLANGKHTLELIGKTAIQAIRVYTPPAAGKD